ncbi:putative Cytosine-specific methyltransferase [Bradyrhizobium sp. ORS 285]|uniref:DNA cytosine methyltransferase n=1 Tax=Bradyrhizobium sp. ORS 285 TaxID=115808 RepID=UPI0002409B1C|nr:DNA cytosine methyltransferase [Bradyrhizobium sp. ORS 285]CCD89885.1 putative Cytosine-specific methyltransferase [Bradyrhizobium sp. ORS 285]SMX61490.1 putative Cytosine-specific methyltransferase [Bradyrhizobium sp. ORS 285]
MAYRLIDLFAGAGGMTLGFTHRDFCGGFESVLSIDNDQAAVDTHASNFGGKAVCADIEEWLKTNKVPKADVVIGGPPCQGFSLLNKNRIGDERRALWEPFLDVVELSGARTFVMENVAELYSSAEFLAIKRRAKRMGFEMRAAVLNTADYGVPQTRKRTIALGFKANLVPSFPPTPTHAQPETLLSKRLPRWRTVRDAIADLPATPIGTEIGTEKTLNLHFGRNPTDISLARYAAVPPGGNRFDLQRNALHLTPQCWIRKTSGGTDLFGRLWWDRPSVTIRTEFFKPEKGRYLHPVENRPITHREAARLMGFPDSFHFCGTKVEIARQIGNAVPPPFAGAIAEVVKEILSSRSARPKQSGKRGAKVAA